MEYGEYSPNPETRLKQWEEAHKKEVDAALELLEQQKVLLIEGATQSGKTSLALAIANKITSGNEENGSHAYFTVPPLQEVMGAKALTDRTGITYMPLPPVSELEKSKGKAVLVVDEISNKPPYMGMVNRWKQYMALLEKDKAYLIFIAHPGRKETQNWVDLLPQKSAVKYNMGDAYRNRNLGKAA